MNIDDIGNYLREQLTKIDTKEAQNSLFSKALEFKVSKRLLKDLEGHYKNGKPNLRLVSGPDGKKKWEIVSSQFNSLYDNSLDSPIKEELTIGESNFSSYLKTARPNSSPVKIPGSKTLRPTHTRDKSPLFQNLVNTFTVEIPSTLRNIFTKKRTRETGSTHNEGSLKMESQPSFRETGPGSDLLIMDRLKSVTLHTEEDKEHVLVKGKSAHAVSSHVIFEQISPKRVTGNPIGEGQGKPNAFKRGNTIELESSLDYPGSYTPVASLKTQTKLQSPTMSLHARKHSAGVMYVSAFQESFNTHQQSAKIRSKEVDVPTYGFFEKGKTYADFGAKDYRHGSPLVNQKRQVAEQQQGGLNIPKTWSDVHGYVHGTPGPYGKKHF